MNALWKGRNPVVIAGLLPVLIPFLLFFMAGILITVLQSFGILVFNYRYEDLFSAYKKLFQDAWFVRSFLFSLYVAAVSSTIAVLAGFLIAYLIWQLPVRLQKAALVYKLPLIFPHLAAAYLVLVIFSGSGLTSSWMHQLKITPLPSDFPDLIHGPLGIGIILSYVFKETSFVILMALSILHKIDPRQILTARMFGAGFLTIITRIVLPYLLPVLTSTWIILFIYSFGSFEIPFVLGDSYPGMAGIRIYQIFFHRDLTERPVAMAMLTIILVFTLVFVTFYNRLIRYISRIEGRK